MGLGNGFRHSGWARLIVLAACVLLLGAAPAAADTAVSVNTTQMDTTSGDGSCSLPEAVAYANGTAESDCAPGTASGTTTITIPAGTYTVTSTLQLTGAALLNGAGSTQTDIDGNHLVQVLSIASGASVQITDLKVSGGNAGPPCSFLCSSFAGNNGGGIANAGTLRLQNVTVAGNAAGSGYTGFYLCFSASCPGENGEDGGDGGGIYNTGSLTVADSTIANNLAGAGSDGTSASNTGTAAGADGGNGGNGGSGGGIFSVGGTLSITDSTISDNAAGAGGSAGDGSAATASNTNGGAGGWGGGGGGGGGVVSHSGPLTVVGSTLVGNSGGAGGTAGAGKVGNGTGTTGPNGDVGQGGPIGGLEFYDSSTDIATLANDTFTANQSGPATTPSDPNTGGVAGAIGFRGIGTMTNLTVARNAAASIAGGIYVIPGSSLTERNSIFASNTGSDYVNCAGAAITDGGHNIAYGDSGNGCPGTVADPKLQMLAANGGPTQTIRLSSGSPAIDAVPASACAVATDQRGVGRPQGAGCDAGAYEVAPPGLTAIAATATGSTSATVNGQITPNLADTVVIVRYGTGTAYGSTTAATDLGAGSAAKPLAVTLSGLQPKTTYHLQVMATNADGTSTSADLTLTTAAAPTLPAGLTASVQRTKIVGDVVSVALACQAGGADCAGGLKLQSRVTTRGRKVVKVTAASARHRPAKPKRRTATLTVGGGSFTVAAGQTAVVKLALNSLGKRLLKARHRLPTTLETSGVPVAPIHVTFIYKPPRRRKR